MAVEDELSIPDEVWKRFEEESSIDVDDMETVAEAFLFLIDVLATCHFLVRVALKYTLKVRETFLS